MRVTMDQVWDQAREVLAARTRTLASIAAATLWLSVVIEQGIVDLATGGAPAAAGLVGLLTIPVALINYWGKLAIIAVAGGHTVTARDAYRASARRLPVLIGLLAVALLVLIVLALPIGIAVAPMAARMPSYTADNFSVSLRDLSLGRAAFVSLYALMIGIVLLWALIRLLVTGPVVLLERRGVASFRRSFEMTRGHFWPLLGAFLLYLVALLVAVNAALWVTGVVARLLVGPAHPAIVTFVTTLVTAAIAAAASTLAITFVTRFYLLRVEPAAAPPVGPWSPRAEPAP